MVRQRLGGGDVLVAARGSACQLESRFLRCERRRLRCQLAVTAGELPQAQIDTAFKYQPFHILRFVLCPSSPYPPSDVKWFDWMKDCWFVSFSPMAHLGQSEVVKVLVLWT